MADPVPSEPAVIRLLNWLTRLLSGSPTRVDEIADPVADPQGTNAPPLPDAPVVLGMNVPPPPEAPDMPQEPQEPDALPLAQRQEDEARAKMISDYAAELPALHAAERELQQYRVAELAFLEQILPAATRAAITRVHEGPDRMISAERDVAEARTVLADAQQAAAEAKERADSVRRGGAAIRNRIRRAQAVRAEAQKASDAGQFALAYWLVLQGGRLDQVIKAEPAIVAPEDLGAAIQAAANAERATGEQVATLATRVEALEAALQQDRVELGEVEQGLDVAIRAELMRVNPAWDPGA